MEYMCQYPSPVGILTATADDEGITGLYLRPPKEAELLLRGDSPHLAALSSWLDAYFRREAPDPEALRLKPVGTPFRMLIWKLLLEIPYGETRTYGQLAAEAARRMGKKKMSAQAVGGAVGHNPISIIIPCHRVVAAGNKLGGFGWGPEAKQWLLGHEGGNYDD